MSAIIQMLPRASSIMASASIGALLVGFFLRQMVLANLHYLSAGLISRRML